MNTTRLTTYAYYDGFPAMTQTDDGTLWLVWSREIVGNLTLFYQTSSNLGKTWSQPKNLTQEVGPGQHQNAAIMQAENGTLWVVWASTVQPPLPIVPDFSLTASPQNLAIPQGNSADSTITATSINGFSEIINLSVVFPVAGVTTSFNPQQITPPSNGQVNSTITVSVSSTATPGNYTLVVLGKSSTKGHTINIDLEITDATEAHQTKTYAEITTDETPSSPVIEDYEIYCKTSQDNGATWSRNIHLTDNTIDDMRPAIIQLANGTIMLFWQNNGSGNSDIWFKTTTNGSSWSSATQLTTETANDRGPAVIQAENGYIWVVWSSNRLGNYELFFKIHNGSSWSNDTPLSTASTPYSDTQPAITQAVDGTIMVFWASDTATSYDIYYTRSIDNGSNWTPKASFAASSYEDIWPSVMRGQDTKIWVTWFSNQADDNWEVYCRTSLVGDINNDGIVNIIDLEFVANLYGEEEGNINYDVNADVNRDGIIDMRDLRLVAYNLQEI